MQVQGDTVGKNHCETTTKVQLRTMSFPGVPYRNSREELLTGVEMTQNQLHHQSPPSMGDGSRTPAGTCQFGECLFQQAALPQSPC